jgi:capsule polysaccharide export protein KpsE/RkpR
LENATTSLSSVTKRLDSISREIAYRQRMIAQSQDQNIFNKKRIETVDQQKIMQELATLGVMYNDATTSKENAKAGMVPQNNIVRVIDDPMFSTSPKHKSKLLFAAIGFAVSLILIIIPLLIQKAINDGREEDKIKAAKLAAATAE